jgi:hypothetical protein
MLSALYSLLLAFLRPQVVFIMLTFFLLKGSPWSFVDKTDSTNLLLQLLQISF